MNWDELEEDLREQQELERITARQCAEIRRHLHKER